MKSLSETVFHFRKAVFFNAFEVERAIPILSIMLYYFYVAPLGLISIPMMFLVIYRSAGAI